MTLSGPASLCVVILTGAAAAYVFSRWRVPAGEVVGPVLAVGALCAAGCVSVSLPLTVRFALQVVVGATIGQKMSRETLRHLKGMAVPALLVSVWVFIGAFGIGRLLETITGLDHTTCVLASCPGGLAEMSILAVSFEAVAPVVVVFQLFRLMTSSVLLPTAVPVLAGRPPVGSDWARRPVASARDRGVARSTTTDWGHGLLTVAAGLLGGFVFARTGMPAAWLTGSMLGVGTFRVSGRSLAPPPRALYLSARTGLGILVGTTLRHEVLPYLGAVLPQAALVTALLLMLGLLLGFIIRHLTQWPLASCLLSSAPAGFVLMAVVADGMGIDPVRVSLLHLVRVITIVLAVPAILSVLDT